MTVAPHIAADALQPPTISEDRIACGRSWLHRLIIAPPRPWARLLVVHGYGKHGRRHEPVMRWLAERGVACEAPDLRGHGRSPGRRGHVARWEEYLEDARAAWDAMAAEKEGARFILGHSHGGLIVAAGAEEGVFDPIRVRGIILSAPYLVSRIVPSSGRRLLAMVAHRVWPSLRLKTGLRMEWMSSDPAMVQESQSDALMNRTATPRWYVTMTAAQQKVLASADRLRSPVLCLCGEADRIADSDASAMFIERCASPDKSFYLYPRLLHELLREAQREQIFADILSWMKARV